MDLQRLISVLSYDSAAPMIFNSGLFLWLFAGFLAVYALLQRRTTARLLFVTAFSYYFYYKSSGTYFLLLAFVTVSDFFIGRAIPRAASRRRQKLLVTLSIVVDLALLGYFKYTNFFASVVAGLTGGDFSPWNIFLPVGISFFTFQSLSYTIDIYRRDIRPLDNLLDYAFYVSFFPQLVAGPIVRARDFIPQIRRPLLVTNEMFGRGLFLIVGGLFKKAVISDYISINFVDRVFNDPTLYSGLENLLAVYGYAIQIYCDFSGYSDMAIGLALLLGFRFNINFDSPYKSCSITEFWRRWHISLSSWLRDYIYISLGGNRKGKVRRYANLMATMLLGGLWHGAAWNFVLWGALHGAALCVHKGWMRLTGQGPGTRLPGWRRVAGAVVTFHFVCLCWVLFRSDDMTVATGVLSQIFTQFHASLLPQVVEGYRTSLLLMLLGFSFHFLPDRLCSRVSDGVVRLPWAAKLALLVVAAYIVVQVRSSDVQPFIYFQF